MLEKINTMNGKNRSSMYVNAHTAVGCMTDTIL